jgi:Lar family restriction alleviation protein
MIVKACPFCGTDEPSYVDEVKPGRTPPQRHYYECRSCKARGPYLAIGRDDEPQMQALAHWNLRAAAGRAHPADQSRGACVVLAPLSADACKWVRRMLNQWRADVPEIRSFGDGAPQHEADGVAWVADLVAATLPHTPWAPPRPRP